MRWGEGFQEVYVTYNNIIHSSCEIKDLVDTHLCKIVCDIYIKNISSRLFVYIIAACVY